MSSFREKAAEIKAAGESERGNFQPSGVPLRMYNFWLDNSESKKAAQISIGERKENFCHFWRVVAIWAPLLFVGKRLAKVVDHPATFVAIAIAIVALVVFGGVTSEAFREILIIISIAVGILAAAFGLFAAVYAIVDHYAEDTDAVMNKILGWFAGTITVIAIGTLLTALIIENPVATITTIVSIAIAVGLGFILVGPISDFIAGRRKIAKAKYEQRIQDIIDGKIKVNLKSEPREPNIIEKFLTGFGDFIILIAQVVRVNKWKICPFVEVK